MSLVEIIHKKFYEKILYVVRHHYVTFFPSIALFIALILTPFGAFFLINANYANILSDPIWFPILVLVGSIYYLSICLFFYGYFIDFYLDILVITNDRLVDINQNGLLARTIAEFDLYQIQDVTSEVDGLFPSIFNYGNLTIQTAGAIPKAIIKNIPDPHRLRQVILDLAAEDKKYHQTLH